METASCRHCGEIIVRDSHGYWAHLVGRSRDSYLTRCQPPAPYGTDAEPES